MPYAYHPGYEVVHLYSVVCACDIFQIYLPSLVLCRPYCVLAFPLCLVCFTVYTYTSKQHSLDFRIHKNNVMLFVFLSSLFLPRNVLCPGLVCVFLLFHNILVNGYIMINVPVFSWWEFMLLPDKAALNILVLLAYANKGEVLRRAVSRGGHHTCTLGRRWLITW